MFLKFVINLGLILGIIFAIGVTIQDHRDAVGEEALRIKQHMENPCDQCRYIKVEKTLYDKNYNQFIEVDFVWDSCPTLKK